jgi:hypothetical protein
MRGIISVRTEFGQIDSTSFLTKSGGQVNGVGEFYPKKFAE